MAGLKSSSKNFAKALGFPPICCNNLIAELGGTPIFRHLERSVEFEVKNVLQPIHGL